MSDELERFDPSVQRGRIAFEHLHRYAICKDYAVGRRVLDLGCGVGYGTAILAASASQVVGVDLSSAAIGEARRRFGGSGARFRVGDCFDLPFEDASFDMVVALEMIEHVEAHGDLLAEIRRVLTPDGLLLVSTPNKPVYNRYKTPNHFHVAEMDLTEFRGLLSRHFKAVQLTGTRMALLSVGFGLGPAAPPDNFGGARLYRGRTDGQGTEIAIGDLALTDPEYVIAVCSDTGVDAPPAATSLFHLEGDDLWLEHEKIMAWASGLHEEDEVLRRDLAAARQAAEAERAAVASLATERGRLAEQLDDLRAATRLVNESVDSDKQSAARDLGMSARLLNHILGHDIAPEHGAIVEALFHVKERLLHSDYARQSAEAAARQHESRAAALETGIAIATGERDRLVEALASANQQLAVKGAAIASLETATATAKDTIAELQLAHDRLAETLARLDVEVAAERQGRMSAETEAATVRHALADLEAGAAALRSANSELQQLLAAEREAHAVATTEADSARRATADLEADAAGLRSANSDLQQVLAAERAARAAIAADAADARRAAADIEAGAAALRSANSELQELLAAERAARGNAEAEVAAVVAERDALTERLAHQAREAATALATPASAAAVPLDGPPDRIPVRATSAADRRPNQATIPALHRQVQDELRLAKAAVVGQAPPPPPARPRRPIDRLLRRPPFRTLVFDAGWIARRHPEHGRITLQRYLSDPTLFDIDPHPLFAGAGYLNRYPDVRASGANPLSHYLVHGWREGRDPHPLFANDWYLWRHPDVAAGWEASPLEHYLTFGWKEGRWPNPVFDPRAYLDRYPDVAAAGVEPLTHYVAHGEAEHRRPPIRGGDPDWQPLADGRSAPGSLIEVLLTPNAAMDDVTPAESALPSDAGHASWPPPPVDDYWPPQALREYVSDGFGPATLDLTWYLLSVMAAFNDRSADFVESNHCQQILARLRVQAGRRAAELPSPPDATIIIPVYNNVIDTLICLASLLETDCPYAYDIIVADDGSTDATSQLIASIGGIVRYMRQPRNLGFLENCNAAAEAATGRHLVFLNNDTIVFPNWLDGLLAPFQRLPRIGLVGSKLLNWDGTLQEAGGILWRDGSAWNFGRGQDARAPEYNYLKDVDYCSGASLALPTEVWRAVGGFDQLFVPAYCEDSDLAFRLRALGYRTLYNPRSELLHHEGRSHGRDVASGIKAYQVTNQRQLIERWRDVLEREHFPNAQQVHRARDRSARRRHILIVDHYVPQWDKDAGSRTMLQFMEALLQADWQVTFWPENLWRDPVYTPRLQEMGIEVIYGPDYRGGFERFLAERDGLFDCVLLSRPHIAKDFIEPARHRTSARIAYYGHDVHFRRMEAQQRVDPASVSDQQIADMRQQELAVCNGVDVVLYPSSDEADFIGRLVGPRVRVASVPAYCFAGADLAAARAAIAARTGHNGPLRLLFVGGFGHPPNVDALLWFCGDVVPELARIGLAVHLTVVGSNAPPEVRALASATVTVLGFVSDDRLREVYADSDVVIAPLRFGAGVKGKVVEAMARGVPVVTTSIGAQGLSADGLFIADDATGFAAAIRVASAPAERQRRANLALDEIERHYTADVVSQRLDSVLSA